jgi:hypothetical protein
MKLLTNLNLEHNELQNALMHPLSSAPAEGQKGQLYYNNVEDRLYQHNGTAWVGIATMTDLEDYVPLSGAKMTGTLDFDGTSNPMDFGTSGYIRGKTTSGSKFDIFGYTNPTNLQVGGTYPALSLKGKNARPTYNGSEMALLNDVQSNSGATSLTATLLSTGWTNNGDGRYVQTVAVTGVTESTPIVMVDVALYSNDADENALIVEAVYQTDGSIMQQPVIQGAGTLTFYSAFVPEVDIPLFVGVVG